MANAKTTWISIEGIDGSGKSSAAEYMKNDFENNGKTVLILEHPKKNSFFGKIANNILKNKSRKNHLFFLSVAYTLDFLSSILIAKKSKNIDIVIFVRYTLTSAYISKKSGEIIYNLFSKILPNPNVNIFLNTTPEMAISHINTGRKSSLPEMFENLNDLIEIDKRMKSHLKGTNYNKWTVICNTSNIMEFFNSLNIVQNNIKNNNLTNPMFIIPDDDSNIGIYKSYEEIPLSFKKKFNL